MAQEGTGTTITFGTSSFTAEILRIQGQGNDAREALPTTHLGTTEGKTFKPEQLRDGGSYTITFHYDGDQDPPVDADPEAIVIIYPLVSGQINEGTAAFTGFLTEVSEGPIEVGSIIEMTATLKVSGVITRTAST